MKSKDKLCVFKQKALFNALRVKQGFIYYCYFKTILLNHNEPLRKNFCLFDATNMCDAINQLTGAEFCL